MSNIASQNLFQAITQKMAGMFHLTGTPRSASEVPTAPMRRDPNELTAGGYNEAYIMQHWASYSPRQ